MDDIILIGRPTYANRGFLPLAVQAGILATIQSLNTLAMDDLSLALALRAALQPVNAPLAEAITYETLRRLVEYAGLVQDTPAVLPVDQLPPMLNREGPASVAAGRDVGIPTQINVTFSEPPLGFHAEIYLDGVFRQLCTNAGIEGWVSDVIAGVAQDALPHTVRVLFVRSSDGAMTRFGPIADFS